MVEVSSDLNLEARLETPQSEGEAMGGANKEERKKRSQDFYETAHGYLKVAKPFKNFTLEDTIKFIDDLDDYKPPDEFFDRFPYYLAGHDHDGRQVWVVECGKLNVKSIVDEGKEAMEALLKYTMQGGLRALEHLQLQKSKGINVDTCVFIGDWDGLDYTQVFHIPISYAGILAFNLGRPFLGKMFAKTSVYGTDKAEWSEALRQLLPEETIPTWYGGREDFEPLEVYGYKRPTISEPEPNNSWF